MTDTDTDTDTDSQSQSDTRSQPVPTPASSPGPPRLTRLTFHGPLSEARATELVRRLAVPSPRTVLDLGCGWGELMLRVLAAVPEARGVGVDVNGDDLARGRWNAAARGLAGRVEFVAESAVGTERRPADLVLCLGASQALSRRASRAHRRRPAGAAPAGGGRRARAAG